MFTNCMLFNAKQLERQLSVIAEEEFKAIGMHHSYGYMLTAIASKEYIKTKEIATILGLKSSTVTRMVAKLENDGLVKKGSENSKVDISLTTKGKQLLPEIKTVWDNFHIRVEKLISANEQANINQTLIETNLKLAK